GFDRADSKGKVCFLSLGDQRTTVQNELSAAYPDQSLVESEAMFRDELATVVEFIEEPTKPLHLALELNGTVFQKQVWTALAQTQPGEAITYRELAIRIGSPGSSRAVGAACGQNRIALAIPCHRAVRSDGKVSGFRWGMHRKLELLRRERRALGGTTTSQLHFAAFANSPAHPSSLTKTTRKLP
ncbi:MAG: methylated-DNA--[protein]-cysteine S-methyltransferase, partial [Rhodopirellula sp. JB055]|uniref:methylated-DNA--[protein]-cysteine S-methyltransferase n=1 Tax=Rhodopirellula sp. JB055 TaxID=3342846 RepID=UPI00370CB765